MDHIFTNSENVHGRLLRYCGFDSSVLYPPVDISSFSPTSMSDSEKTYFLSFARLSPPKRIDIIVDAFIDMPDQNLIFTYGKNDPMKDEILSKIK
jgi:glycosyltransferase involved in cell wall biosynthesis